MKIYCILIDNIFSIIFKSYEDAEKYRSEFLGQRGGTTTVPMIYETDLWNSFDDYINYKKEIIDLAKRLSSDDIRHEFIKKIVGNEEVKNESD